MASQFHSPLDTRTSVPGPVAFGLPRELLEGGVRRLGIISLGMAGTLLAMILLVYGLHEAGNPSMATALMAGYWGYLVAGIVIVLSLGIAAFTRMQRFDPYFVLDVGMVYAVAGSFGIALLEHLTYWPGDEIVRGVSWVCVWVVLFPVMVPATPGKTFLTVATSAAMGPLSYMVLIVAGYTPAPVATMLGMFLPNGAAVGLAMLVSGAFYGLGRHVAEARQMGNYRLVEKIGEGGMGEVWRAVHRRLGREAAVKFISGEGVRDSRAGDSRMRRFEREAAATAKLRSAHTVELYDFGLADNGTLYFVMELLSGVDLRTLVERFGPLPPGRVVYLLRQVCRSLAEAHAAGLVHRDIKPANLFSCCLGFEVDVVKVLDFGMVRAAEDTGETSLTADGAIGGTPAFFAPEMALGGKTTDHRSDIYALGCVAYYLTTGEIVFEAETPVKAIMAHLHERPLPPSQRSENDVPADLEETILSCLEKDPEKRPQSALALAEALGRCACATDWTAARSRQWWDSHLPDRCAAT